MAETKTPAKKTAPTATARKRPAVPPMDYSTLTVTEAPAPTRSGGAHGPNPFAQHVADSWDNRSQRGVQDGRPIFKGAGRKVTVPNVHATTVVNMIRAAASNMTDDDNNPLGAAVETVELTGGNTEVRFCAKTRKVSRKSKTV